ncbi:MAG TPA: DoxX family membrane protein [Vicinamibacterales bacterium]|nr:DoxX family membrane protein [Vicinamibacterales bacterium]
MARRHAWGLVALRLCLGVFFLFEAISKIGWFTSSAILRSRFAEWVQQVGPASRAYLQIVCIPGVEFLARVVPAAEFATAIALILGGYTRLAAVLALLMVLNFHFASGVMFQYSYLTNGYGLPVLGGLIALALGGAGLPLSVKK